MGLRIHQENAPFTAHRVHALEQRRRKLDTKALAGMLAAEIDTMIRHAERRGYEEHYRHFLERFEAGNFSEMPSIGGMDDKLPDIAAASVDRLGLLDPELCRNVGSWYGSLRGIKIDLLDLGAGRVRHEECAPLLREVLNIWLKDVSARAPLLGQEASKHLIQCRDETA